MPVNHSTRSHVGQSPSADRGTHSASSTHEVAESAGGESGLDLARTCVDLMAQYLHDGDAGLLQLGNLTQAETIAAYVAEQTGGRLTLLETREHERSAQELSRGAAVSRHLAGGGHPYFS